MLRALRLTSQLLSVRRTRTIILMGNKNARHASSAGVADLPEETKKDCGECQGCSDHAKCLAGTVGEHGRHVLVCTGTQSTWGPKAETTNEFIGAFAAAVKSFNSGKAGVEKVKITAIKPVSFESNSTEETGYEVIVYPEGIAYTNMKIEHIPEFMSTQLREGKLVESIPHVQGEGSDLFICTHTARDRRCGDRGIPLAQALEHELEERGLTVFGKPTESKVRVWQVSHIGGHKYAGNVVVFPAGDYYGYVTPSDVSELVDTAVIKQERVKRLWRGAMGLTEREQLTSRKELF